MLLAVVLKLNLVIIWIKQKKRIMILSKKNRFFFHYNRKVVYLQSEKMTRNIHLIN